jgi:hypothetical protein
LAGFGLQIAEKNMKTLASGLPFVTLLLLTTIFSASVSAQKTALQNMPGETVHDVPRPKLTGSDPKPVDATAAILTAFDTYEVVGISAAHGNKDLDDFLLKLIRNPAFPGKVNDVVVECGNSLYQSTLDRYIAGGEVPLPEVRQVWRNTTQAMCGLSAFYEELFPLIRRINQTLPPEKQLRVLAGDSPIDWSKVKTGRDFGHGQFLMRDASIAAVIEQEVLAKHRKALMLFGTAHLFHADDTAVGPVEKYNGEFEARMAAWPVPSLVQNMKGTWLLDLLDKTYSPGNVFFGGPDGGKLPAGPVSPKGTFAEPPPEASLKFSQKVDAYLYLGPRDLLLNEPTPAEIFLDKDYMAELQRRAAILGGGPMTDDADPQKVSARDSNPFFYDPDGLKNVTEPLGFKSTQ